MTDLPWDRFGEPEELPYLPPLTHTPDPDEPVTVEPYPVEPPRQDWGDILDEAWPVIRDQVVDYARATVAATLQGKQIDHIHPTVTDKSRDLVIADAKSRSWRTLAQGLAFDVIAAIVVVISTLSGADLFNRDTWIAFGVLLGKSVVSAVISYFMRLKIQPTAKDEEGEKMHVMPLMVPMREKSD